MKIVCVVFLFLTMMIGAAQAAGSVTLQCPTVSQIKSMSYSRNFHAPYADKPNYSKVEKFQKAVFQSEPDCRYLYRDAGELRVARLMANYDFVYNCQPNSGPWQESNDCDDGDCFGYNECKSDQPGDCQYTCQSD